MYEEMKTPKKRSIGITLGPCQLGYFYTRHFHYCFRYAGSNFRKSTSVQICNERNDTLIKVDSTEENLFVSSLAYSFVNNSLGSKSFELILDGEKMTSGQWTSLFGNQEALVFTNFYAGDVATKRGFYIEIGSDGEDGSVSLFSERSREWDGLLIESHPGRYRQLRQKHRKALTLRACVRVLYMFTFTSIMFTILHLRVIQVNMKKKFEDAIEGHVKIPCLWLESILNALDKNTVDLLSVDARDQEMELLKAIPLSKYAVNVITVEFVEGSGSDLSVMRYLLDHGYHANHQFVNHPLNRNDMVFTRKKSS
ncbi:uncharacterized protein LOC133202876 [Saccostrea echinata]|uniref:uncharacterized protein LOC133202876 n=1 Tax=Saccostrea echinata TaxID=191078 RepID=UPI002A7FAA21|nr:uncharacterized protein LOC133202876 [Saccostrea echinata]